MKPTCVMLATLLVGLTAVAQTNSPSGTAPTPATTTAKAKPATTPAAHVDQWPKATGVADAKNSGHATEKLDVVEYKDGEDGTMHTRPSANKTTQPAASTLPPSAPTATPATDAVAKKHVAGVKYEDRQAAPAALDAASKDAAKSAVVNPRDPQSGQASGK